MQTNNKMTKYNFRCPKCKRTKLSMIERIPEEPDKIIIKYRYTKKCGHKQIIPKSFFRGIIE